MPYKVVLVGNSAVGKSSLMRAWCHDAFQPEYDPTVFDNGIVRFQRERRTDLINLWDTSGNYEEYHHLIAIAFPETDIFLLCFDIGNPDSLNNIERYWVPFIRDRNSDARFILVGLKKELRTDQITIQRLSETGNHPISFEEAVEVSRRINAAFYCECSSRLDDNVTEATQHITQFLYETEYHSTLCSKFINKFRRKLGRKFFFKKRNEHNNN